MNRAWAAACVTGMLGWGLPAHAALKVGDPAPPLRVAKWIKGKPVDLSKAGKDQVFVIEFWATWCGPCRTSIPHLSQIQKHFGQKVTVIGVSDEKPDVVRDFVRLSDRQMQYTVAADDAKRTTRAYLVAAGARGIPHAFIVRDGKIAWHGHPLAMDEPLIRITGDRTWGEFLAREQAKERKRNALVEKTVSALQEERWDDALAGADGMIALNPSDEQALMCKFFVLTVHKQDAAAAQTHAEQMLEAIDDAPALLAIARAVLMDEAFKEHRNPRLALAFAEKARKNGGADDLTVLDTLARAKFETGAVDEAIALSRRALKLCDDEDSRREVQASLDTYLAAKNKG
jgi:thiol-disulfide isomerase/thioredoxin